MLPLGQRTPRAAAQSRGKRPKPPVFFRVPTWAGSKSQGATGHRTPTRLMMLLWVNIYPSRVCPILFSRYPNFDPHRLYPSVHLFNNDLRSSDVYGNDWVFRNKPNHPTTSKHSVPQLSFSNLSQVSWKWLLVRKFLAFSVFRILWSKSKLPFLQFHTVDSSH